MTMNLANEYAKKQETVCRVNDGIAPRLYEEYGVNQGLRDEKGNGVLTGLTNISKIISSKNVNGKKVPCDGELWYRGYRVEELINSLGNNEMGFEKVAYLLLMGELPSEKEQQEFTQLIGQCRTLPTNFTRDVIMKAPTEDIMNSMTRSILTLASYDKNAKDSSVSNSLRQCIQLISEFPLLAVYAYNAYNYYEKDGSMFIHHPDPNLSTAENLLMMMRQDKKFTPVEAKVLDTALILHMEHGG
ncbi:MAG: citrate/2-methylcitrate synthase, partial [Lachnospiraceae bacterium]|nr:citrate/2-methylcitrate synthase [Lachnospiraceae bacterium]